MKLGAFQQPPSSTSPAHSPIDRGTLHSLYLLGIDFGNGRSAGAKALWRLTSCPAFLYLATAGPTTLPPPPLSSLPFTPCDPSSLLSPDTIRSYAACHPARRNLFLLSGLSSIRYSSCPRAARRDPRRLWPPAARRPPLNGDSSVHSEQPPPPPNRRPRRRSLSTSAHICFAVSTANVRLPGMTFHFSATATR